MNFTDTVRLSFKLWWNNLPSVLVFSFISAILTNWPYFFHMANQNFHLSANFLIISAVMTLVNLIPNNAIFARLGHAMHEQPIKFSQALAVSLLKFPQTALWLMIILLFMYTPLYFISFQDPTMAIFFLLYLLVAISIGVYCLLIFPLMINDNYSLIPAIKTSFKLIQGQWWYTGLVISVPVFFAGIFHLILNHFMGNIGDIISISLFLPLNTATIIVLCEHHKARVKHNAEI